MMSYYLFLIFIGLLLFHTFIRYSRKGRLTNKVQGPTPYPIIGNALSYDISSPEALWRSAIAECNKYYPILRVWSFTCGLFVVKHPDDLEVLMTSPKAIKKGYIYDALHPWLNTGLLTSTGEKWKQRRKILTPAFHFNIISKYNSIAEEQGLIFINNLKSEGKEVVKSLVPMCSRLTLKVICESALGVAFDKIGSEITEKYSKALYNFGSYVAYRMPRPYLYNWMFEYFPFLAISRRVNEFRKTLHQFSEKLINERKEYHKSTDYKYLKQLTEDVDEAVHDVYMGKKKRLAMLDLLLSAEQEGLIDYAGIKEEVDTFTFEGHDTSAMAMVFTLSLLAENKDIQNMARAEVTEIMDKNDGKLGIAQIQECCYLERCIKEALRLYPSVPVIFRQTADDTELQLKHALLPAGAHVAIYTYLTHRDPNFWPEPEKFDPDRFLPEHSKGRHPYAYIPFSAGPRNCIGQKFAMNELRSLIGLILYNFYLEPVDRLADIEISGNIVLKPDKPIHVKFIQIEKN